MLRYIGMYAIVFIIFLSNLFVYSLTSDSILAQAGTLNGYEILAVENNLKKDQQLIPQGRLRGQNDVYEVVYTYTIKQEDTSYYPEFKVYLNTSDGMILDTYNVVDISISTIEYEDHVAKYEVIISINNIDHNIINDVRSFDLEFNLRRHSS